MDRRGHFNIFLLHFSISFEVPAILRLFLETESIDARIHVMVLNLEMDNIFVRFLVVS